MLARLAVATLTIGLIVAACTAQPTTTTAPPAPSKTASSTPSMVPSRAPTPSPTTALSPSPRPTLSLTPAPGSRVKPSDFNGDGYSDLAIGVRSEAFGSGDTSQGVVNVLYGSADGLRATGNQLWSQASPGVDGKAEPRDRFGSALASGDFDGDGFADLAVGARHDETEPVDRSGGVNVLYGSRRGLTEDGDQYWVASILDDALEPGGELGAALAAADFDGDGYVDLAIGAPGVGVGPMQGRGAVAVLAGGANGLVGAPRSLTRSMTGAADVPFACHGFGEVLDAGDLNGDGYADLAVGALAGCDVVGGDVSVFYGSPEGLAGTGSQLWSQDSPGIADEAERTDRFGSALAIGDFDGDGIDDLAVSAPYESLTDGASPSEPAYGAVHVIGGSPTGLSGTDSQRWTALDPALPDGDWHGFGAALAAGDLDGDGADELVIAALEAGPQRGGAVIVMHGDVGGLSTRGIQTWSQDSPGVPDRSERTDAFGRSLAIADYGRSDEEDLAVGVINEAIGAARAAGLVNVLYGSASGLSGSHAQAWTQDSPGVKDSAQNRDDFGSALTP